MVPNYYGFNIVNVMNDSRAFALHPLYDGNYVVGAYSTNNINSGNAGEYNFFLDIFFKQATYYCIYSYGSTATLTATPNEGYMFINWTENGQEVSTNPVYSFTVTEGRNLQANFAVAHTVSVEINPEDGGTVSGAGTYLAGSTCLLTAASSSVRSS